MKIESGKVILEKLSDSSSFEDFLADVHVDGAPRYAIIKLAYQSKDGRDCEKLVSITWCETFTEPFSFRTKYFLFNLCIFLNIIFLV